MKNIRQFLAVSSLLAATSFAGTLQTDGKNVVIVPDSTSRTEINFRLSTDYVGKSDFRFDPAGEQDAYHANIQFGVSVPIKEAVYLTVNGFYDRLDFSTSLAPVPTTLQKLGTDIAIEYRAGGETAFTLIASPGIYGSEIDSDSFNVPITAYGSFRLTPSLVVVAGARYNQWSEYQILPSVGLIWTINDQWKVRALATAPRIEFTPNDDLTISFGGELLGGTYRTSLDEQNFQGKHLDYCDYRAGLGVTYRGWKPLVVSLTTGWSFERNLRYDDIDVEYRTEGAPYVGFSAKAVF